MEKTNVSQSLVVKCSPLNRGVIGSQDRDSASLSWNCLRNWLLVTLLVGMKRVCNYKDSLFIGFIFIEYLLCVRHSSRSRQDGEE